MKTLSFEYPTTPGLVSVITPTRNGDEYIGAALESVAAQEHAHWEAIVIEDGSRGRTESIVREFAERHPGNRVHYARNETSQGAANTRNRAFELAQGEYVAFLDCDDRWLPTHLAACVDALARHGDDVAYSAAAMFEDGSDHMMGFWGPNHDEIRRFPQSLLGRSFVTPSATVVRRSVIEEIGAWNSDFRYCEDAEFFFRVAKQGKRFRHVGGVHCLYRKAHEGATTQRLAGTLEEFATLTSWHADMPGGDPGSGSKLISNAYAIAGGLHAKSHPDHDPSAIRSRAAPLLFRSWLLHPTRISRLGRAIRYAATRGWSQNDNLPPQPPTTAIPSTTPSAARKAA